MITLKSHGFKYSRPEANFVFDVSYFKNPWREEKFRTKGKDDNRLAKIEHFMKTQDGVMDYVFAAADMITVMSTNFCDENLIFAFCCSAGEYRSPIMVELVAKELHKRGVVFIIEENNNQRIYE